ncbi:MAG TPA: DUF1553 domain-containing protein, partial [Pirellulales bacterium]
IAPLLAARCLGCHNATDKKGELDLTQAATAVAGGTAGAAIVASQPDESYLWQRVRDDEMPPKKPLAAAEKELLRGWIEAGAAWGTNPIDRFRYTSDVRGGYDWWSLQPVRPTEPPAVHEQSWPRGPLDRFVLARLEGAGLKPSPEADRRTLIRRLSFDLTGLPPVPNDVAAFVADQDPQAYKRLVDRLLASPQYGERWARHWLDLARFGESNGFEYDEPRRNAWPYRDWVIDALNRDLPFDEFARQQLAGDVLLPGDPDAIKATGFLTAGAYDTAGQNQQSAAMKAVVRQDELEDLVGTTCQTFLALTVNCARCHDHKFDAVRQSEYYRLTSALGGVRHGERDVTSSAEKSLFALQSADALGRIAQLTEQIVAIDEPARAEILQEREASSTVTRHAPTPLSSWDFSVDTRDKIGFLHGTTHGAAAVVDGGLMLDGAESYVSTIPLSKDLGAKTLEVWLRLSHLQQAGGGVVAVQKLDGSVFDAIVFGEREPDRWMAGSNNFLRSQPFGGPAETIADKEFVHIAIVYAEDGTVTAYRNGVPYGKPYSTAGPVTYKAGESQVVIGMRHGPPGGNRMLAGKIARAALYERALTAEEVATSAASNSNFVAESAILARLSPDALSQRRTWNKEIGQLRAATSLPPSVKCYAVAPRQPEPAHLLVRGDIRQQGTEVTPGGIAALAGSDANFSLSADAPEAQRRAALAHWITSPQNPLFARVIVNRVWHYHFGMGLVDTPNDFGFNGGRPTHPELLDWLAAKFVADGFSLKQLHRTIVLSATYRQASTYDVAAVRQDAENRLLWRKRPQRLEAEAVRDATLAVAGELNPARGGAGFADYKVVLRSGTYTYLPADPIGPEYNRRSVYRTWTRGGRNGLLDAFDCPDPSTTAPRRALTTTPLQALVLLNNSFVLRMADAFACRLEREAGAEVDRQVHLAYQLACARSPADDELATARRVVSEFGLPSLTRAIFNSNEFLYVD